MADHQLLPAERDQLSARPLSEEGEEDIFVENGEISLAMAHSAAAAAARGVSASQPQQRTRTIKSSACIALACLAAAGGAGAVWNASARRQATSEIAGIPASYPVVVKASFPSVSLADEVLLPLDLDVMGRGRRHLSEGRKGGFVIERDILIHSESDWSILNNAVSSTREGDVSYYIDKEHTDLLHLDESTTYNPPSFPEYRRHLGLDTDAQYETMPSRPCYRTVDGTIDTMQTIASTYPDLATIEEIGNSYLNEPILMLKITGPENTSQSPISNREPMVLTAGVHAREYAPPEIVARFAEYVTSAYGTDADVTAMLDHTVIYAVLQSNPDSRRVAEQNLADAQPRKNQNNKAGCSTRSLWGIDLNRNFDFMHGSPGANSNPCHILYRGQTPASEAETTAIQNLSKDVFPTWQRKNDPEGDAFVAYSDMARGLYVDVHSYGRDIIFPYGFEGGKAVGNIESYKAMSHKICSINKYEPSGSDYYFLGQTSGDTLDYHYGALGVASILYEVGKSWAESCEEFEAVVFRPNFDALLYTTKLAMTPYRTSMGPDIINMEVTASGDGKLVTIDAEVSDFVMAQLPNKDIPDSATQNIQSVKVYFDSHPYDVSPATPLLMDPEDGSFNSPTEGVSLDIDTSLVDGKHMICLHATDSDGYDGTVSCRYVDIPVKVNAAISEHIDCPTIADSDVCEDNDDCRWREGKKNKCIGICQGRPTMEQCLKQSLPCGWNATALSCYHKK